VIGVQGIDFSLVSEGLRVQVVGESAGSLEKKTCVCAYILSNQTRLCVCVCVCVCVGDVEALTGAEFPYDGGRV
jgi:hypothetical protein